MELVGSQGPQRRSWIAKAIDTGVGLDNLVGFRFQKVAEWPSHHLAHTSIG